MHTDTNRHSSTQPTDVNPSLTLGLIRVTWTILGPLLLVGSLLYSAVGTDWVTRRDVLPVCVVAVMILCRGVEQRSEHPLTAYGDPSSPKHFKQWMIILMITAGCGWVVTHLISRSFFR